MNDTCGKKILSFDRSFMNADGKCCCNCARLLPLNCHPCNSGFGKGSILKSCGWVCLPTCEDKPIAIYSESQHGLCEMHKWKKEKACSATSAKKT